MRLSSPAAMKAGQSSKQMISRKLGAARRDLARRLQHRIAAEGIDDE